MDLIEAVFFFGVFSVVILAITIFLNAGVYVNQVGDIESIKRLESNKVLLKQKSDILTKEFKTYLGEKYPDLEERIFSKMSATAAQVYLVQYPELQSSKVFINLVAEIKDLQKDIFNQDLEIQKKQKDIRVRDTNS
jgi:hypothetical protein